MQPQRSEDTKRIIDAATLVCGNFNQDAKRMCIGYMIANTSLQLKEIGEPLGLVSLEHIYINMFQLHRHKRDNDKEYSRRYFDMCKRLGTKNRL